MAVDDVRSISAGETFAVDLQPAAVPEWEVDDELGGHLAGEPVLADETQARRLLDAVRLELPLVLGHRRLTAAPGHTTPFGPLEVDATDADFHLVEVPLDILLPPRRRLVRLRMRLQLGCDGPGQVITRDLFPRNTWRDEIHEYGEVSLDLAKGLTFVCPGAAECLGLKLSLPIRWRSTTTTVAATGHRTDHVEWSVEDEQIGSGFIGYAVLGAPRGRRVTVDAELACEIRHRGPRGFFKARATSRAHRYELPA